MRARILKVLAGLLITAAVVIATAAPYMPMGGGGDSDTVTNQSGVAGDTVSDALDALAALVGAIDECSFETLDALGDVGTGATQVAQGNHAHAGAYEPVDATIMREGDEADVLAATGITDGYVLAADGANGVVWEDITGAQGPSGPTGPSGAQGDPGAAGADGTDGEGFDFTATVCADGCDYTSIATAISTESTSAKVAVYAGSYTESANIDMQAGQQLTFLGATTITLDGYEFIVDAAAYVAWYGTLTLTGTGASGRLLYVHDAAAPFVTSAYPMFVTPTVATLGDFGRYVLFSNALYLRANVYVTAASVATANASHNVGAIRVVNCDYCQLNLGVDSMTVTGAFGAAYAHGIEVIGGTQEATVWLRVGAVTTDTGSTGKGYYTDASYSTFVGSSRGSDSANGQDAGTGNNIEVAQ